MQRIFISFPCTSLYRKAYSYSFSYILYSKSGGCLLRPPATTFYLFNCYEPLCVRIVPVILQLPDPFTGNYFAAAASVAHPSTNAVTTLSQLASV